jgi:hypothetical protein
VAPTITPRIWRTVNCEWPALNGEMTFSCQNNVVATPTRKRLTRNNFAVASRIHIGGIDKVNALIESAMHNAYTVVVVTVSPRPKHHVAQAQRRNEHSGTTKRRIFHLFKLQGVVLLQTSEVIA